MPLSRNNADGTKHAIVNFVNRKHSEDVLRLKKIVSSVARFLFLIHCALTIITFGASVKICNEEASSIRFSVLVQLLTKKLAKMDHQSKSIMRLT